MQNVKVWVRGAVMALVFAAAAFVAASPAFIMAKAPEEKSHWHHHDGHWSYWSADDNRWYYTDGSNWFYNTGEGAWAPYAFDKKFGREGFEREEYKVPGPGAKVTLPTHGVYHRK